MADHKHLVNTTVIGQTFNSCTILKDNFCEDYYLITGYPGGFDWNGECYDAVKCDKDGNVTEKHHVSGEISIYPVDNWDDDGNFDRIGYSTTNPDYPKVSLDLIQ